MPGRFANLASAALTCSVALAACGGDSGAARADAGAVDASPPDASLEVIAANYCELIRDPFCDFYLRCGRMNVTTMDECRAVFLESCNAKYESRYVDLEAAGLLTLSADGLEVCAEHLETVACEQQFFELDGPCAELWTGTQKSGDACGLDVEYFVCEPEAACTIGLDFCGTCETLVGLGMDCSDPETSCGPQAACDEGICVARVPNGEACTPDDRCMSGSACIDGFCTGPTYVAAGAGCDQARRCPYLTACIGGVCSPTSLLGEPCSETLPCETGVCESGTCVALRANGELCSTRSQCQSGLCDDGTCAPRPGSCIPH